MENGGIVSSKNHLNDITNLISSSSYPTTNLYQILRYVKGQCILEENKYNIGVVIKEIVVNKKTKFDKYWKVYSAVLVFGAIVDRHLQISF